MRRMKIIPIILMLLISGSTLAEPSAAAIAQMMKWYIETGGPALQNALGHKGFAPARPAVPVYVQNETQQTIYFAIQSKSCDWGNMSLEAGEGGEIDCPTTSGDNWYNVAFDDKQYGLDGGKLYYFEFDSSGKLEIYSYEPK